MYITFQLNVLLFETKIFHSFQLICVTVTDVTTMPWHKESFCFTTLPGCIHLKEFKRLPM